MGPDEADEDQAGTNRLELCFALPTHIYHQSAAGRIIAKKT